MMKNNPYAHPVFPPAYHDYYSYPYPMAQGPVTPPSIPSGGPIVPVPAAPSEPYTPPGQLPLEQSFIENILRMNLGKVATIYMTFENNPEWNAKIFRGRLEAAGRDHIIVSDPATGRRYLLLMVNLDYITFDEPLKYFPS
jgi:spore germination protein Q